MPKTLYLALALVLFVTQSKAQCTNPPPQPGSIIGNDPVCAGSSQTFTIYAVPGADDYTWVLPSGWTGTSTGTSITVTVGTGSGWLYVSANNQCGTSPAQGFYSQVMEASISANASTTFCAGGSVVLHAMDNTGTGIYYQWYKDGLQITGATTSNYTATTTGNYHVTIASNNCQAVSAPTTVSVEPYPATPTATNSSPTCLGTMLSFTGACSTPGVTYNWTGPNNFPNTQNPSIADTHPQDAGVYTLTVVTGAGCSSSVTTTVQTQTIPATPPLIAGPDHICAGETTAYSVLNDVNATQYNWNIPNSWTGTSTTNNISVTAGNAGGTVSVSAGNACGTSNAASKNVIIDPQPFPVVVQSGGTLSTNTTFSSYQWYWGTSPVAGATSQNFTPTQSGTYFVFVQNSYGCSAQSPAFYYTPVGVNILNADERSLLYPSPNNGEFQLEIPISFGNGEALIQIVDAKGSVVYRTKAKAGSFKIKMEEKAAPGVYLLRITNDVQRSVMPFVKQ